MFSHLLMINTLNFIFRFYFLKKINTANRVTFQNKMQLDKSIKMQISVSKLQIS